MYLRTYTSPENFIRTSQIFIDTFQNTIRTSQNFIRTSQNFIRTSQNFIRTFQPSYVRPKTSYVRPKTSYVRSNLHTYVPKLHTYVPKLHTYVPTFRRTFSFVYIIYFYMLHFETDGLPYVQQLFVLLDLPDLLVWMLIVGDGCVLLSSLPLLFHRHLGSSVMYFIC